MFWGAGAPLRARGPGSNQVNQAGEAVVTRSNQAGAVTYSWQPPEGPGGRRGRFRQRAGAGLQEGAEASARRVPLS